MYLLTAGELAKKLSLGKSTVYEWAACGIIPCVKLNGVLRFDEADVEAWIEANKARGRKEGVAGRLLGKVIEAAAGGVAAGAVRGITGGKG